MISCNETGPYLPKLDTYWATLKLGPHKKYPVLVFEHPQVALPDKAMCKPIRCQSVDMELLSICPLIDLCVLENAFVQYACDFSDQTVGVLNEFVAA
jgi:hypothetical protein